MPEMSETVRQDEAFIMKGRLAVILAADVAGGRRLISEDENGTGRAIRDLHARWSFKGDPQHQFQARLSVDDRCSWRENPLRPSLILCGGAF